jgi:hypothetical protein
MLISSAIRSRTCAVGVGFLLNSTSNVVNWSCVARCRFWFFCCCVSVLFRGGRLDWLLVWPLVEEDGDGVVLDLLLDAALEAEGAAFERGAEKAEAGAVRARATGCSTSVAIFFGLVV